MSALCQESFAKVAQSGPSRMIATPSSVPNQPPLSMSRFSKNRNKRFSQGFSLVEVAMALGVVSFVMVTLVGLLPGGLTSFKKAMANTIESQIVQSLTNDLLLNNFSNLVAYAPTGAKATPTYYYDSEGVQFPSQTGAIYKATITLSLLDSTNSPVSFNNNDISASPASIAAYCLVITITNVSDNTSLTLQHPHKYSIIIANNGL